MALAALLATVSGPGTAAADPAAAGDRVTVAGSLPHLPGGAVDRGAVKPSATVDAKVYLAGRDPRGLAALAAAVSNPASPSYRHYLKPAEVAARFGPSASQVDTVKSWLAGAGLRITHADAHYVAVRGSIAAVRTAFGTDLHSVTAGGRTYRVPDSPVTVPRAVSASVAAVSGLDTLPHRARPHDDPPPLQPVTLRADPCATSLGQRKATDKPPVYGQTGSWTQCGYTPQQLRAAYGLDATGATGEAVTVAVVDAYASPTLATDTTTYDRAHGFQDFRPGQLTVVTPPGWTDTDACGGNVWYDEEHMDVQAVHAMAPDAKVTLVAAASCDTYDLLDSFNTILDHRLADLVSNSWGLYFDDATPQVRDLYDAAFQRGAAEGIGFYFAPGDCGAYDPATSCGSADGSTHPQVEYPSESPWATAVGGTTVELDATGHKVYQTGWGDNRSSLSADGTGWSPTPPGDYPTAYQSGSGGGTSVDYTQPDYQAPVVPASLSRTLPDGTAAAQPMRVIPDVATDADNNTGMLVGQTQVYPDGTARYHETRWGGTSLACPLFVGIQALAQQENHGAALGFANPQLYQRSGSGAFDDVTDTPLGSGTNLGVVRNDYANVHDPSSTILTRMITFGHDGLLHATTGFDDVTGLGSPSASYVQSYRGCGVVPSGVQRPTGCQH